MIHSMKRINRIMTVKTSWFMMMIVMILVSCKVIEKYKRPEGIVDNSLYRDVKTADTTTIANIPWKLIFNDTLLQGLIQEGIDNNLDLKIALARIKQSQANLQQNNALFYPALIGHADGSDQKLPNSRAGSVSYQLYGSTSWEADIWGKLKSSKRVALAALLQSYAYERAVQTQLVSDIASNYYTLLALDAQLAVTQKTVTNRTLDVEVMKQLKESDVVTGAAVVQSEANLYSAEVTIPDLRQNIRVVENAMCILIGRNPGSVSRDSLNNQQILNGLQTGVPAQLLANRPDVQEAEYQLRYNFELTNVAKTYFYPSLTITAEGGLADENIFQLFNTPFVFGNIVGGLVQPVFNQGLNKQRLKIAQAKQEEYIATFKKTILNAGQEVSNALYDYQAATDKMKIRLQQISFLQKSVEFTKELLKYSANTNYTDVLTSEQSLLAARLNSVSDKLQQLQANVALYRSLGGGWK